MSSWRDAPELARAIELHERGEFRAAHESFEDAWRAHGATALGETARALSQWSAACVHLESGRESGFRSVAAKSARRLAAIGAPSGTELLAARIAAFAELVPLPDARALRSLGDRTVATE